MAAQISRTKIEERGVSALRKLIDDHPLLREELKTNDKSEAFDGTIKIYKDNPDKKANIIDDNIRVQVKATKGKHDKRRGYVRVSLDDLRIYQRAGGVLYFYVYLSDSGYHEIYYKDFLPVDLVPLLQTHADQKTITERFKKLESSNDLYYICLNFSREHRQQSSFNDLGRTDIFINDTKICESFVFYGAMSNNEPILRSIVGAEHILYKESYPLNIPQQRIVLSSVKIADTVINGIRFNIRRTILPGGVIKFGQSVKLTVVGNKVTFSVDSKGTLNNRIEEIEFCLELMKFLSVASDDITPEKPEEGIQMILKQYNDMKKLMDIFNVGKDLDLDTLDDKGARNLDCLVNAFVKKKTVPIKLEYKVCWLNLKIANIQLLVLAQSGKDGKGYYLQNGYVDEAMNCVLIFPNGKRIATKNRYLTFRANSFQVDNYNKNLIIGSIDIGNISDGEAELANLMILELIKAYDKSDNILYLECAEECIRKLLEYGKTLERKINYWQILFRQGKLKDEVIAEISRSIDESSDVPMLLAMHILLQNREETVKYKKRLSEDQLTLMKEFPIWALYVNVVGVSE